MSQLLDCCTQHGIVWDKYSCEFSWQMSVSQNDDRRHRNADNLTSFCVCVSMESFNKSMDEHISRECSISFLSPCKVLGVRPSSNRLASRHNQKKWSKNIPSLPQVILFYIIKRELNWPSPYCLAILCLIPQVPRSHGRMAVQKNGRRATWWSVINASILEELVLHLMQEWVPRRRWRRAFVEFGGLAEFFLPLPRVDRIFFQKKKNC